MDRDDPAYNGQRDYNGLVLRAYDHTFAARRFLGAFNWQGGFDYLGDTEGGLREILEASFHDVELEVIGSIAVFAASNRRTALRS